MRLALLAAGAAALPPPKTRYQLTPEDIMSGRVVSASAVPASPIAVQQRDPGCPTAADVMATNASDRWAVWDSFPEGSLCRLDTSECGTTAPCTVDDLGGGRLRFEISEGRNRQIRRMVEAVGLGEVRRLHRVAFAGVGLEGCEKPGAYAFLSEGERGALGLGG